MKKHNFSAGPAILPREVIEKGAEAVLNFQNSGLSLLEMSHRGKEFVAVMEEARQLPLDILGLDDSYTVLYLQGGASTQFCMIPYNYLDKKAAYLDTGTWANKAIKEAKFFGEADVVGSSEDQNYNYIPRNYQVANDNSYFHITTNNTIYGTELKEAPQVEVPLIADMSSDIFARNIEASKYDLIYAGAQKNLGPAGATLVIMKKDLLGKAVRKTPSMLSYKIHDDKESMYNTPPAFAVYMCMETLRWVKATGLDTIEQRNNEKAATLYNYLDQDNIFNAVVKAEADRSIMNVTFTLDDASKEQAFLDVCKEANIVGIKGHRSVGGFRASMYNALTNESVETLVDVMKEFNRTNG